MDNEKFSGREILEFKLRNNAKPLFNFNDENEISNVKLNGNEIIFRHENNFLEIDSTLPSAIIQKLEIQYSCKPEHGLYFYSKDSVKYLYSVNEPIFAPGWFACSDTPNDKFLLSVKVTNDSSCKAISNGRKVYELLKNGNRETLWKTSYPIASYLTALYVGKYSRVYEPVAFGKDTLKIEVYSFPEDVHSGRKIISIAKNALTHLSNFFGDYPFIKDKYAIAEIPWSYGGIENQTAIGIGADYFRSPEMFNDLLVHETAHEWWGNSAGISGWDDIWIDEGMANYSQALFWEKEAGKEAFNSTMSAMLNDALQKGKIRGREKNLFGNIVYDKSSWIFRMLNYMLGDSIFFKSLKDYLTLYKYKTGNAEKLKRVFEKNSRKNLDRFFKQWIWNKSGFIDLNCNYKLNSDSKKATLNIRQKTKKTYSFILPVVFYSDEKEIDLKNFRINSSDTTIVVKNIVCDSVAFDPDYVLLRKRNCN